MWKYGVVILLLAGCTNQRFALDEKKLQSINETEVYNLTIQEEVRAKDPYGASSGAMFGVIGVLIESSMASSSNSELQNTLNDFYIDSDDVDFRSQFQANVVSQLEQSKLFSNIVASKQGESEFLSNRPQPIKKINTIERSKALLYLNNHYHFTKGLNSIQFTTDVQLYNRPGAPLGIGEFAQPLYKGWLGVVANVPKDDQSDPLSYWSENDAAHYRKLVETASEKLASMLIHDMRSAELEVCARPTQTEGIKGNVVGTATEGTLIRLSDSRLLFFVSGHGLDPKDTLALSCEGADI